MTGLRPAEGGIMDERATRTFHCLVRGPETSPAVTLRSSRDCVNPDQDRV